MSATKTKKEDEKVEPTAEQKRDAEIAAVAAKRAKDNPPPPIPVPGDDPALFEAFNGTLFVTIGKSVAAVDGQDLLEAQRKAFEAIQGS